LRAFHDAAEIGAEELRAAFLDMLAPEQCADGTWAGYWWPSPAYPTSLALEVWVCAGRPPLASARIPGPAASAPPFELACRLLSHLYLCQFSEAGITAQLLLRKQQADGAWPSAQILRLPPSHEPDPDPSRVILSSDARRIFSTATALKALCAALSVIPDRSRFESTRRREGLRRSQAGRRLDLLVQRAAATLGFDDDATTQARRTFSVLTRESLAHPSPWPSAQLSALSAGSPLEFSVAVGRDERPALRYTAEVGQPYLSSYPRVRSGIETLRSVAGRLGYDQAWRRIAPALDQLVSKSIPAPDGLRFWVWGGIDCVIPEAGEATTPILKVYTNLLERESGGGRARLEGALAAAGIALDGSLTQALDLLDDQGFLHECGFGLGPSGGIAFKLYYELPGWRPGLVAAILKAAGIEAGQEALRPEIPGLLKESLAQKRRSGIALRLDPADGRIREVTVAAAFLPPMLSDAIVDQRVAAWLEGNGWDASGYRSLSALLLSDWEHAPQGRTGMHSLFTRTVSRTGNSATVYLRPYLMGRAGSGPP
jgi:hypothetical protein